MDERRLLIALNASTISRAALCRLAQADGGWYEGSPADAAALAPELGVPSEPLRRALAVCSRVDELADRELELAARRRVEILTLPDASYPEALFELALPPPVLYCRGRLGDRPAVAIVGARRMDGYGREATELFASRLAAAGMSVVSGFARGIDATAHRSALSAADGHTVAVLGCGVDVHYPRGQSRLADRIAERGALLSEFPFAAHPRPWHFPIRNRVIAALSWATLVVQAKAKSGSLITAHHALELGRDVYAVPGRIFDELSMGTNQILADGALLAGCPEDLLEGGSRHGLAPAGQRAPADQGELFAPPAGAGQAPPLRTPAPPPPDGTAGKVLESLPPGCAQTAEDVAGRLDVPVDRVLGALLELELAGWVRRQPGPVYVR